MHPILKPYKNLLPPPILSAVLAMVMLGLTFRTIARGWFNTGRGICVRIITFDSNPLEFGMWVLLLMVCAALIGSMAVIAYWKNVKDEEGANQAADNLDSEQVSQGSVISALRKKRDKIQTTLAMLWALPGFYIIYQYQHGAISKNQSLFWIAATLLPVSLFDIVASFVTGESYCRGISFFEEKTPKLFFWNTVSSAILLFICVLGVIVYW